MKRLLILTLFFVSNYSFGQFHLGIELGGSNFLGYAVNIEQRVKVSESSSIIGKAGFGGLFPGWPAVPTVLFKYGIHYNYRNWGIGGDVSKFTNRYFTRSLGVPGDVNLIFYPNINYSLKFGKSYFVNFSVGAYFAYYQQNDLNPSQPKFEWAGDVIPGIGITIGKALFI